MFTFQYFKIPKILSRDYCEKTLQLVEKVIKKPQKGVINLIVIESEEMARMNEKFREDNIQALIDNPGQIVSSEGERRVKELFRDYQVIGLVANNPIFPIEPLATYGNILAHVRTVSGILHNILSTQSEFYAWREKSHTQSIFPLLNTLFRSLSDMSHE